MNQSQQTGGGIGFFGVVFIVLLVLKLLELIEISWWWVTAPLWGPAVFGLLLGILYYSYKKIMLGNRRR